MKKIILISLVLALFNGVFVYGEGWSKGCWIYYYDNFSDVSGLTKDGTKFLFFTDNLSYNLYDLKQKTLINKKLQGDNIYIEKKDVALSNDGKLLAIDNGQHIVIYNIEDESYPIKTLSEKYTGYYYYLRFSEDNSELFQFQYFIPTEILRWNIETCELISTDTITKEKFTYIYPSRNGNFAVVGYERDTITLLFYNINKKTIEKILVDSDLYLSYKNISITDDGKYIVYSTNSGIVIYDCEKKTNKKLDQYQTKEIIFTENPYELILDNCIYDFEKDKIIMQIPFQGYKSGDYIIYENWTFGHIPYWEHNYTYSLWNFKKNKFEGNIPYGHDNPVQNFVFSPDGTKLASVDSAMTYIWDCPSGGFISVNNNNKETAFIPDSKYMLLLDSNKVTIYDYEREENVNSYEITDSKILKIYSFNNYNLFCCITDDKMFFVKYPDMNIINQFSIPQGASLCKFKIDYQNNA